MVLVKTDENNNKLHPYPYRGNIQRYIAKTTLIAGQPVCYTVDTNDDYILKADVINSEHTYDHFLGICINDVNIGEWASILISGITYVNRLTIYTSNDEPTTSPVLRKLDINTNNNIYSDTYIKFTDSGNTTLDYSSGEQFNIKFDAGENNEWLLKIVNTNFEHTSRSAYDRLLLWLSNDNFNYVKADIDEWLSTASTTDYGTTSYGGSSSSKNVAPTNQTGETIISISNRYLRWNFISDFSDTEAGWEMYLWVKKPVAVDAIIGNNVYVNVDGNISDNANPGLFQEPIGKIISPESIQDRVKIFIK
mgnify:CR=1 FL=1